MTSSRPQPHVGRIRRRGPDRSTGPAGTEPGTDPSTLRFARRAVDRMWRELLRDPAPKAAIGELVAGRYRIERELGSGGMGTVHLAVDTRLGRQVAIKRMRPDLLPSLAARSRFSREGRAIARLDHPGICALFDTGEHDGQPFLVLQYLRGSTLSANLAAARAADRGAALLAESDCLLWGEQVARALHHAHERGLRHGDIKPANIVITERGACLLDFGLARPLDDDDAASDAGMPGTIRYMAPEQSYGGAPLGAASDVFSLALVIGELLLRRHPLAAGPEATASHADPAGGPPSSTVGRLRPDVAKVLGVALRRNPADRHASAAAFADDLATVRSRQSPKLLAEPDATRGDR